MMAAHLPPTPRRLLAVVLFMASLVAFDRVFFAALQLARPGPEVRSELRRKLEEIPDKARYQMLVLGTSRTYEAVHPAIIRASLGIQAFKEAFQGKGPRYDYEFYQVYERVVGRPKWVVYGIDYFVFEIRSDDWAMARFDARPAPQVENAGRGRWLLTLANKSANDRVIMNLLAAAQAKYFPSHEFAPERYVADMEAYTGAPVPGPLRREVPATYERRSFPPFPGAEGSYLVALLDQWEREGVAVLLVSLPDYIGTYETNYQRQAFLDCMSGLVLNRKHIAFVDYSDPGRFPLDNTAYFWDGGYGVGNSHLSRDGAAAFARVFIPDLRRFIADHPRRVGEK